MFATDRLEVPWTFSVPVRNAFVDDRALDTYRFPVMRAAAFERVKVLANRLVVVRAFEAYTFPITVKFEDTELVHIPTLLLATYMLEVPVVHWEPALAATH